MGVLAGEQRGRVVGGHAGGELAVGDELALHFGEGCLHGLRVVGVDAARPADRL